MQVLPLPIVSPISTTYIQKHRCHNAPHSHQLGWAGPIKTLHKDNWPAGQWNTFMLPAAVTNPKNFIRIWPDWSPKGAKSKIYVQYRCGGSHWGGAYAVRVQGGPGKRVSL